jgi:hypothetical protein
METNKKCIRCQLLKPLFEYYTHPGMFDKHLNKCKECCKEQAKERESVLKQNQEWVEKERARGREKSKRLIHKPRNKEQKKEAMNRYYLRYPEKQAAGVKTRDIKSKVKGNHLHHWSYNIEHALDVIELTKEEHYLLHRFMIYDQERKMYRTINGVLLDTKESQMEYLKILTP